MKIRFNIIALMLVLFAILVVSLTGCAKEESGVCTLDSNSSACNVAANDTFGNSGNNNNNNENNNGVSENTSVDCSADSDCVPKECCHAISCIPASQKSVCNVACTMDCKPGTMDCGNGHCECKANKCVAVIAGQ